MGAIVSGRSHSKATRLAATFLAKLAGVDTAAATFGIDRRTVRSWTGSVEVPEDPWTAIRDVLLARGSEMAAKGDTRGLPAILTGAGIAERNVRYGQLIAQRDGRRVAKVSEDDAVARRWRRRTIRDEVDPTHWSMTEHRTGEETEPYLAAKRRLDYLRITRINVIDTVDNAQRVERGEEPRP